ncbi:type VI secretion system protein VasJ [Malaciobacter marinus]|uniref:Type VI secretion system protein VasJ n=1 Tax=Malaciobacter marinus TaxID=505249 RepID=A0AB36ZYS2_9BACT|nr:TssA family type VI secretion system protein [Malaciobacter marinus]PPK61311.1 type VI secretion system protein VasJ [Malaciobacter marinus]SKB66293.1 type VI secretion system protein VasJ [Malaciobacter marinus]
MSALILQSIDDSIVGKDFKYDDAFLSIEQEIDKSHSAFFDGSTDWELVLNSTQDFLINKSKDFKIATWWIYSCWKVNAFIGLEINLPIYINFINEFNDKLYPKSIKGKSNIIFWLEEQLTLEISQKSTSNIELFYELFCELNNTFNKLLKNEDIYFKKIINIFKTKLEENSAKEELKKQEQVNQTNNEENRLDSHKAIAFLREFKKDAAKLANFYREEDFIELKALRITRFLSWLETDGLPLNENSITQLNPPSILELDDVKELYKNSKYEEAVKLIEEIIEVSPFWFDGHYYIYKIFKKLNKEKQANEVKNLLIYFLKTNEGILDLKFKDNSSFASPKTKKWINENIQENPSSSSKNENDCDFEIDETLNFKEAINLIDKKYISSQNIKDKFLLRLKQMQLAIENNKESMALALFDELEKYIVKHNLIQWDAKLVSEVYVLFLSSFSNLQVENEQIEKYYSLLCKIDINSALKINI